MPCCTRAAYVNNSHLQDLSDTEINFENSLNSDIEPENNIQTSITPEPIEKEISPSDNLKLEFEKKILAERLKNNTIGLDEAKIRNLLNDLSLKKNGIVNYLGSYIDNVSIKNQFGLIIDFSFVALNRELKLSEQFGKEYQAIPGPKTIYMLPFTTPNDIYSIKKSSSKYVALSTVETFDCSKTQDCKECEGSTVCTRCGGEKIIICPTCDGTGSVQKRVGTYKNGSPKYKAAACDRCLRKKTIKCPNCYGSGLCSHCEGSGEEECIRCKGTGYYQKYMLAHDIYKSKSQRFYDHAEFEIKNKLKKILPENKIFSNILVAWQNESDYLLDNRNLLVQLQDDVKSRVQSYIDRIIDGLEKHKITQIKADIYAIPIKQINYNFENSEYALSLLGENYLPHYNKIPAKHFFKKLKFIDNIKYKLFKNKLKKSYINIAKYLFLLNNELDEKEIQFLKLLCEKFKIQGLEISATSNNEPINIKDDLEFLSNDKRIIVFAWFCINYDHQVTNDEIDAFNHLVSFFNLGESDVELLKKNALVMLRLEGSDILQDFLNF
jgi:hypothetical protein